MENLEYYEELSHNFLLAYEKTTEFFVMYIPETREWADCNISFSNFKHDYDFKKICKEEVLEKTNGNLPESKFQQYLGIIYENRGCTSN